MNQQNNDNKQKEIEVTSQNFFQRSDLRCKACLSHFTYVKNITQKNIHLYLLKDASGQLVDNVLKRYILVKLLSVN